MSLRWQIVTISGRNRFRVSDVLASDFHRNQFRVSALLASDLYRNPTSSLVVIRPSFRHNQLNISAPNDTSLRSYLEWLQQSKLYNTEINVKENSVLNHISSILSDNSFILDSHPLIEHSYCPWTQTLVQFLYKAHDYCSFLHISHWFPERQKYIFATIHYCFPVAIKYRQISVMFIV